jgi:hypothetical protein
MGNISGISGEYCWSNASFRKKLSFVLSNKCISYLKYLCSFNSTSCCLGRGRYGYTWFILGFTFRLFSFGQRHLRYAYWRMLYWLYEFLGGE